MFFWWSVFLTPLAASTAQWVILSSRRRDQLRHLTVMLAMGFGTMAASLGIWMLLNFPEMLLPANPGRKIVLMGSALSRVGGFAAVTWVVIERNWLSWRALAISGWMFIVWGLILLSSD